VEFATLRAVPDASAKPIQEAGPTAGRFGMFAGVFTRAILTILGVVMSMRMGWVTGSAGLGYALGIIVVAHAISLSTGAARQSADGRALSPREEAR